MESKLRKLRDVLSAGAAVIEKDARHCEDLESGLLLLAAFLEALSGVLETPTERFVSHL